MPLLFPGAGGRKEFLEAFRVAPGSKVPVEKAASGMVGAPLAGAVPPGGAVPEQGQGQGIISALLSGPAQQLT